MEIPQIQIRQLTAQLSIDADNGRQHIVQPRATINMRQIRTEQQYSTTPGQLDINQDRVWDALSVGNHLDTMKRIYSNASNLALQGIARIIEKGDQMAAIHLGSNPIATMAREWQRTFPEYDFAGEASYDNIDFHYTPSELSIKTIPGQVQMDVEVNRPIYEYERGKLNIIMSQYPKVEIIPPQIELLV